MLNDPLFCDFNTAEQVGYSRRTHLYWKTKAHIREEAFKLEQQQ
jgi:hypothetical protein